MKKNHNKNCALEMDWPRLEECPLCKTKSTVDTNLFYVRGKDDIYYRTGFMYCTNTRCKHCFKIENIPKSAFKDRGFLSHSWETTCVLQ